MAGVFLIKGMELAIPRITFSIDERGEISAPPISIKVAYDACVAWARIAMAHRATALAAQEVRRSVWSDQGSTADDKSNALEKEFAASVQAVVASAICIEAFYDHVARCAPIEQNVRRAWSDKRVARYIQVSEIIRSGFKIPQQKVPGLKRLLKALYKLRDASVHPSQMPSDPLFHPELGDSTDWRLFSFRGDVADIIVCNIIQLLWEATSVPEYRTEKLKAFSGRFQARLHEAFPHGRPEPQKTSVDLNLGPAARNRGQPEEG